MSKVISTHLYLEGICFRSDVFKYGSGVWLVSLNSLNLKPSGDAPVVIMMRRCRNKAIF